MKAYIGGDDAFEQYQKQRGFKAYRDLYNKKIQEQENLGRTLREQQKEVKQKHEPNMKQLVMYRDLRALLSMKVSRNKKILERGGNQIEDDDFKGMVSSTFLNMR
jgi:intraflagellar transport protein 81